MAFSRLPRELIDEIDSLIETNTDRRAFARAHRTTQRKIPQIAALCQYVFDNSRRRLYFIFENLYDGGRKYIKLMWRYDEAITRVMMACLDDTDVIEKHVLKLAQNSTEPYWRIAEDMDRIIAPYAIRLNRKNIMRWIMINCRDTTTQMIHCAQIAIERENYTMLELMREFNCIHYLKYSVAMIYGKLRVLQWMLPFAASINTDLPHFNYLEIQLRIPSRECHAWSIANWPEYAQFAK